MDIKDIEILIECKRLVEAMLVEKKCILRKLEVSGKEYKCVEKQIARMERALQGIPPMNYSVL